MLFYIYLNQALANDIKFITEKIKRSNLNHAFEIVYLKKILKKRLHLNYTKIYQRFQRQHNLLCILN